MIAVTPVLEADLMATVRWHWPSENRRQHQRITLAPRSLATRNFALRHSV
jgi:hypothetical protein